MGKMTTQLRIAVIFPIAEWQKYQKCCSVSKRLDLI